MSKRFSTLLINIPSLYQEELVEKYEKHCSHYSGDVGVDIYCPEEITINPGQTKWVDMGINCEMVTGFSENQQNTNLPFFMFPRSSISKTPLRLANGTGIFDAGYRGRVIAALDNIKDHPYTIKKGDRLVQICLPNLEQFNVRIVDELSSSERGESGFGSTGK
jgi:dUTP pyrophosphatase